MKGNKQDNEYSRKPDFFRYTVGVFPIWRLANDMQIGDFQKWPDIQCRDGSKSL